MFHALNVSSVGENIILAERLETIVNMAKKLMQEIAVIDYPQVA